MHWVTVGRGNTTMGKHVACGLWLVLPQELQEFDLGRGAVAVDIARREKLVHLLHIIDEYPAKTGT